MLLFKHTLKLLIPSYFIICQYQYFLDPYGLKDDITIKPDPRVSFFPIDDLLAAGPGQLLRAELQKLRK